MDILNFVGLLLVFTAIGGGAKMLHEMSSTLKEIANNTKRRLKR